MTIFYLFGECKHKITTFGNDNKKINLRYDHIKCTKPSKSETRICFSLFYLGSFGYISIHFECCIQLSQSRKIHAKVISQMCCCLRKLHAGWKLRVSLHA